jgi:TatD DNase family protein
MRALDPDTVRAATHANALATLPRLAALLG